MSGDKIMQRCAWHVRPLLFSVSPFGRGLAGLRQRAVNKTTIQSIPSSA